MKKSKIHEKVQEILDDNNVNGPPIPVIRLIQNYGYEAAETELPNDVAGFIDTEENSIYINNSLAEDRKPYIMMIALGLLVLYEDKVEDDPDLGVIYKAGVGSRDEVEEHQDAAVFARHILVPDRLFKQVVGRYGDVADVNSVAKAFGVDSELIDHKLKLMKQRRNAQ